MYILFKFLDDLRILFPKHWFFTP